MQDKTALQKFKLEKNGNFQNFVLKYLSTYVFTYVSMFDLARDIDIF